MTAPLVHIEHRVNMQIEVDAPLSSAVQPLKEDKRSVDLYLHINSVFYVD